jgi:hypothetical protein
MKTKKQREERVIARGKVSGHSHIITGECEITKDQDKVIIKAGKNCAIKHLLEKPFVEEGLEVWTEEHTDIQIPEGETFEIIQQQEFNPYEKAIQKVQD